MLGDNYSTPPIGSGGYAQWIVFVVVIILSVALAEWLLVATVGRHR